MKQLTKGWLVFMAIVMPLFSMAQFPLSLDVNMPPPYPVKLSSYTDFDSRIFITVNNDSQEEQEIILTGSLTSRNRGLRIETDFNDLPTACILIPPGPGVTSLTGADLSEVFDPNHLIFAGTTADQILNDQALPEDRYTFCLRAYRCSGNGQLVALSDQPDLFQGCFDFEVAYVEPPEIISPICNTILPPYTQNIMFNWLFMPPETGYGGTVFKLKIVELDPIDVNPWDAMLSAPAIFETEVAANSYNLLVAIDGIFEDGKKYAYQVTAYDLLGEIQFRNNGASQVCTFQYVAPPMETFRFDPVYPKPGDYIPFDFFPFIVRFTPYSDDYFYFEGDMQLRKNGSVVDEKHSLNNWNTYGPVRGQNKALTGDPDATMIGEWESRHLPVYKNATLSPHQFDKKEQYAWSFSGEMTLPSGGVLSNTLSNTEFNTGMSPSKLESPSNGATVAPGEIAFTWTTADKPVSLVPPFHIYQASATGQQVDINLFNGVVDERWVMEVAGTDTFESLGYSTDGRITGQYVDDSVSLINELYRQINTAHTITENGTYYWRVKWLSNTEDITSPAYRTSPVWSFTIGTPPAPVAVVEEDRPCVSECLTPARADRTAVSISVGQTLKMGKFDLVVSSISGGGGNTYSGEGEIPVAFMNNVKIKVEFSGLQANATQEVFAGTATAMEDAPSPSVTQITTIVDGMERIVPSFTALQADGISTLLESGDRLVSMISSGRPIGMPIGMDKEIEGGNFVIGIIEMEFTPTRASLMAMAQIDIPDLGEKLPAFGARDVCFSPSGFGDEYVLYLARDHEIAADGDFRFDFKGIESGDSTNASYIQFNCNGFKCATIRGEVTFPRNVLVPENTDGTIDETGFVTGTFSFKGCRGNNYMGEISFSPFEVPGLAGWGFAPGRAYYDWSDLENPPGMTFPSEYDTDLTAETINTWKGFYLTEATIHTPPEFQGEIAGRMSFSVSGIIGDNTGITGTLSANNIINYDDGQLEGWAFSLDRVHITLVQNNRLVAGGIEGKLGTPIFEEDDKLAYSALLGYNSSTEKVKFNFTVTPDENPLTVPMWGDAEMVFEPESSITIDFESGGDVVVTALLTGAIDITGDLGDLPEINFPGIQFQELRISTQVPKFDVSYFGLASPQKNVGGFPVNLRDLNIGLDMAGSGPGLVFDLKLNLQDAGFTAGAGFTIRSAMGISTR
ncbi:MAG: hypothetical protein OEX02_10175, partial [Cyclobacteriaceae bacterium]|nr:hypothetical protein [Cyclobacteriaceae bacterium]